MAAIIEPSDLKGMPAGWSEQDIQAEIDAAVAWVRHYVPCLDNLSESGVAAVNAVLRKAVPYNAAATAGPSASVVNRVNAGPLGFSTETTAPRDSGVYFSPGQVKVLEGLCASSRRFGTIRTRPL